MYVVAWLWTYFWNATKALLTIDHELHFTPATIRPPVAMCITDHRNRIKP